MKNSKITREGAERLISSQENVSIQKAKEIMKRELPEQPRCCGSGMAPTARLISHRFTQKLYSMSF